MSILKAVLLSFTLLDSLEAVSSSAHSIVPGWLVWLLCAAAAVSLFFALRETE